MYRETFLTPSVSCFCRSEQVVQSAWAGPRCIRACGPTKVVFLSSLRQPTILFFSLGQLHIEFIPECCVHLASSITLQIAV